LYVFSRGFLPESACIVGTIEENIAYGLDNYNKKELLRAAKLANAHDFISKFEEGYQTKVLQFLKERI
jgi:ABC-type multidrug transport system fused ATPase/permease subunit